MHGVSDLVVVVAEVTGRPWETVRQRSRALISAGLLPQSAGRHIQPVGPMDLMTLIVSLYAAEKLLDAAEATRAALATTLNGRYPIAGAPEKVNASIVHVQPVLEEIVDAVWTSFINDDQPATPDPVFQAQISIFASWPEIRVELPGEPMLRFVPPGVNASRWQSNKPPTLTIIAGANLADCVINLRTRAAAKLSS